MDFEFDSMYAMNDEMATIFGVVYIIYYLVVMGIGVAGYVLSSVGLHAIAKRRGINKPWLAWIPVVRAWIVGSVSDQFRYVTKGQIRNKRKVLLAMRIICTVGIVVVYTLLIVAGIGMVEEQMMGGDQVTFAETLRLFAGLMALSLALFIASIVQLVFHCMAMYDLYTSVNPPYNVAFLVLSIVFPVTEPYFIFFNRKKDRGMPPRTDAPVAAAPRPALQEPWEDNPEA